ncbi:MAG: thermonuclease family protein [Desulfovibrio sp.]|jgi:endonuclease YncB( thermonuclease family)|nr:thermonuclease family protein [Mailhella sp.]
MKKRAKAKKRLGSGWYWLEILALCALLAVAVSAWHSGSGQTQRSASAPAKKAEQRKAPAPRQESRLATTVQPKNAKPDQAAAARRKDAPEKKEAAPSPATAAAPVSREEYTVSRVADGDTLELRDPRGGTLRVRLYGIDAPEGRQSFGNESRANMQRIAKGRKVRIKRLYTDNFQRAVAIVYLCDNNRIDALSLNERQIQDGMAWVYDFFCTSQECNTWKFEEAMAKTRRIGLWKNPAPVPPWQWRALQEN